VDAADRARRRERRLLRWGGDLAGQGWGIERELGGYRIFDAMGALEPDFFLCCGDSVYADGPLEERVPLPDGRVWRNVVTDSKRKVAETLDEYRGQYAYNLFDERLRGFAARVAQVNQWDDHEVRNNWYPGQVVIDDPRYTERRADVLAARGRRAFLDYNPIAPPTPDGDGRIYRRIAHGPLLDVFVLDMRTYKDPNSPNRYADPSRGLLGARQRAWLKSELAPLAGVHHTSAHHYDPARAATPDFTPFWEFVSGPLNAGTFGPNELDATFGPEAVFVKAPAPGQVNLPPSAGMQFFGQVDIDGRTDVMTVRLKDMAGATLFTQELAPET
jgi:alkaline phosphatase D